MGKIVQRALYMAIYRKQHGNNQLTKNPKEKIKKCDFVIYSNAIDRYYQLGLDDPNRFFELKHLVLHNKYRDATLLYAIRYIFLIIKYPIPFTKRISPFFYRMIQRRKSNDWYDLSYFIKTKS